MRGSQPASLEEEVVMVVVVVMMVMVMGSLLEPLLVSIDIWNKSRISPIAYHCALFCINSWPSVGFTIAMWR